MVEIYNIHDLDKYSQMKIPEGIEDKHYDNFSLLFEFSALGLHEENKYLILQLSGFHIEFHRHKHDLDYRDRNGDKCSSKNHFGEWLNFIEHQNYFWQCSVSELAFLLYYFRETIFSFFIDMLPRILPQTHNFI